MNKKTGCKVKECLSSHRGEIVGAVFLILATLLTILTFSGLGILGMFVTGLYLCCHKHMCCKHCHDDNESKVKKATVAKKTTKTTK